MLGKNYEDCTDFGLDLLGQHYFPKGIYVHHMFIDKEKESLVAACRVGVDQQYTIQDIPKVTGPQYFITVTQIATVLMALMVQKGRIEDHRFTLEHYTNLMCKYELFSLELHFKRFKLPVQKGEDFLIFMEVDKIRKTSKGDALIAMLSSDGAVSVPKISFMAPMPETLEEDTPCYLPGASPAKEL